ncbi:hypothetical protein CONPUDRAFT_159976 [Coniophora puteana RWD-64-598 SS2]|uniref:CxC1-like cysteine cluster associated with KDZ transposases domain-containing protein n=1 Tax=Coniophora puteana (strain RWD-64-598) TaxID=741705 RepID=R7SFQ7_CONPW|nr:uncharacterized protein CONPUDRAFT_159976 [Coniophora puteana RWD-64-598 SS2]EIW74685.1 hypothetical protein CONPUDRAFT_159976 [Coniophora puteana RWD-64-598 SS2]
MNTEPPGPKDHRTWTHRTQHKQANWEVLLPSLVAAYIKWKHPESTQAAPPESVPSTSRESTPTPSLESAPATPPSDAASAPDTPVLDLPQRCDFDISVVDIYTLSSIAHVPRLGTERTAEALVSAGYLGATPEKPTIAFSLPTLELFRRLRLRKPSFSVEAFAKVICDFYQWPYHRAYRIALSEAFDMYLSIVRTVDLRVADALGRGDPVWRAKNCCPVCSYELEDEPDLRYRRMLVFDGNNSLSRMAPVGSRSVADQCIYHSSYFLEPEYVDRFANIAGSSPPTSDSLTADNDTAVISACTDSWKAAAADAKKKSWGIFEETGIFSCACRHGFMLYIADMVRSGELFKYPLAIVNKSLEDFGDRILIAYDIGCKLAITIASSSDLGPRFASSGSRIGSNQVSITTRHASAYKRRQAIEMYFVQWDEDRYLVIADGLLRHYKQALKILTDESPALDHTKRALNVTDADLTNWRTEQSTFLATSGQESTWDVHAVAYVEMLQELWEVQANAARAHATLVNSVPTNYHFVAQPLVTSAKAYGAETSRTGRQESAHRQARAKVVTLENDVLALETKMGIYHRWTPIDQNYVATAKYINERKYHRALDNLQRLVVLRLLELHKLNVGRSGYKLRTYIAKSLQNRCKAIQNALKMFNQAAVELGKPTLEWSRVSKYTFLEEFTLLRETGNDIRQKRWVEPAIREVMKLVQKVDRAKEEIQRCNVEIRRLHTSVMDEDSLFSRILSELRRAEAPIVGPVAEYCTRRRRANAQVLRRLRDIYELPGFSGTPEPGTRKGCVQSVRDATAGSTADGVRPHLYDDDDDDHDDGGDEMVEQIDGVVDFLTNLSVDTR